jgi:hypothetical protein
MRYSFLGLAASTAMVSISLAAQAAPQVHPMSGGHLASHETFVLTQGGGGGGGGGSGGGSSGGSSAGSGAAGSGATGTGGAPALRRQGGVGTGAATQQPGATTQPGMVNQQPGVNTTQPGTATQQPGTAQQQTGVPQQNQNTTTGQTANRRSMPTSVTNQPATDAQIGSLSTVRLSLAQRAQIQTSILEQSSNPLSAASADLSIGATLPSGTVLSSMPDNIRSIAPGYENYKYAVVGPNTIVVVDPSSNTIVDVIKG